MSIDDFAIIFLAIRFRPRGKCDGKICPTGRLLKAAADTAFESVISIDKKIEHEQNLQNPAAVGHPDRQHLKRIAEIDSIRPITSGIVESAP